MITLVGGCDSTGDSGPACTVEGVSHPAGSEVFTLDCGGCLCTEESELVCTEPNCAPEKLAEGYTDDINIFSEFYCCCKSGCPVGDVICLGYCMALGGVCADTDHEMFLACAGSAPGTGCTCSPQ